MESTGIGVKNVDGSFSKSIDTSNIEYLINNGQPSLYGFYVVNEDKFYYEYLNSVVAALDKKDPDWQRQPSHTLKFSKELNQDSINEIYDISLHHGKMLRELNCRMAIRSATSDTEDKITISYNQQVSEE